MPSIPITKEFIEELEQFKRSFRGKLSFSVSQRMFKAQRILRRL